MGSGTNGTRVIEVYAGGGVAAARVRGGVGEVELEGPEERDDFLDGNCD